MTGLAALDMPDDTAAPVHAWRAVPSWRDALAAADAAPRCGARCRTRGHAPCRSPAMPNGRCRMHGGASTGPRTAAGRERCRRAHTVHGARSAEWVEIRKLTMLVLRETRRFEALGRLELAARAARKRGHSPDLDWDDLNRRPKAYIDARRAALAAAMPVLGPARGRPRRPPPPRGAPPPSPKVTLDPMHPEIQGRKGSPRRQRDPGRIGVSAPPWPRGPTRPAGVSPGRRMAYDGIDANPFEAPSLSAQER